MILILLFALNFAIAEECPQHCVCDRLKNNHTRANCSYKGLTDDLLDEIIFNSTINEVNLEGNKLTKLPDAWIRHGSTFKYLSALNLNGNLFRQIPNSFPSTLQKLNLSKNLLQGNLSSDNLTSCSNVTHLDLSNNEIRNLMKDTFKTCKKLLKLILSDNRISHPTGETFFSSTKLRILDLSNNSIRWIDKDFNNLNNLEVIYLSNNKFTNITHNFFTQVYEVYLSNNRITHIGDNVFGGLVELDLSGNQLREFNLESVSESGFLNLNIEGNPLNCSCKMENISKLQSVKGKCVGPKIMEGKSVTKIADVMNCTKCSLIPCLNQGTCILTRNSYVCNCTKYFKGRHCEVERSVCEFNYCANNSTCTDLNAPSGFSCKCAAGFTGKTCDQVDHCMSSPCKNGGSCLINPNNIDEFACRCSAGFTGKTCEIASSAGRLSYDTIFLIAVGLFVFIKDNYV